MPLLSLSAVGDRLTRHDGQDLRPALAQSLRSLPPGAPVVILVHGYRFSPAIAAHDPHEHILSAAPSRRCWKALSWPRALGLADTEDGLAVGFGWEARGTLRQAYDSASEAARHLAALVGEIRRMHAGPVSILTHSLGARVALQSLRWLDAGALARIAFMAGAEFRDEAEAALATPCGKTTEYIGVTARENEMYDFLLERFMRRAAGSAMGTGLGHVSPRWLDLKIDDPATESVLARLGYPMGPPRQRICHWSVYLRSGVFEFYRDLLLQPQALPHALLRTILARPAAQRPAGRKPVAAITPLPVLETSPM